MTLSVYRTIVVGTDGSPLAAPTVARAAAIAATEEAHLIIVCAYTTMSRRADAMNVTTLGGDPKIDQVPDPQEARQALDAARDIATEAGAKVEQALLVEADAAAALMHVVEDFAADLLVIGAIRDRSIVGRLLGTVAEEVVQRAGCDVLIVRPPQGMQIG